MKITNMLKNKIKETPICVSVVTALTAEFTYISCLFTHIFIDFKNYQSNKITL